MSSCEESEIGCGDYAVRSNEDEELPAGRSHLRHPNREKLLLPPPHPPRSRILPTPTPPPPPSPRRSIAAAASCASPSWKGVVVPLLAEEWKERMLVSDGMGTSDAALSLCEEYEKKQASGARLVVVVFCQDDRRYRVATFLSKSRLCEGMPAHTQIHVTTMMELRERFRRHDYLRPPHVLPLSSSSFSSEKFPDRIPNLPATRVRSFSQKNKNCDDDDTTAIVSTTTACSYSSSLPSLPCAFFTNQPERLSKQSTIMHVPWLAVITGGGTGMGKSQAVALSQLDNVHVIITGRRIEPLQQVQDEIGVDKCTVVEDCDIGQLESWQKICKTVDALGGNLCFLGNTAGSYGPWSDFKLKYEQVDDPQTIIEYNTAYITGIQLSYHYLIPYLKKGAAARGKPSVILNASSSSSTLPRGMAKLIPFYHPVKNAMEAITRCAYGMYKDDNVMTYGISPVVYQSEMTTHDADRLGWTVDQLCAFVNPLPVTGDPDDVGQISAALWEGNAKLEGGIHYIIMPVPEELQSKDEVDSKSASKSILFTSSIYGDDRDSLDGNVMRTSLQKIREAYWSSGSAIAEPHLATIKQAMEDHRIASLSQVPPPVKPPAATQESAAATASSAAA
jgi:NAD(P)-dependent dehydrogenase (short-subunit alcohol dehydrogenase family)